MIKQILRNHNLQSLHNKLLLNNQQLNQHRFNRLVEGRNRRFVEHAVAVDEQGRPTPVASFPQNSL